jgi:hypothetical protein
VAYTNETKPPHGVVAMSEVAPGLLLAQACSAADHVAGYTVLTTGVPHETFATHPDAMVDCPEGATNTVPAGQPPLAGAPPSLDCPQSSQKHAAPVAQVGVVLVQALASVSASKVEAKAVEA